MPIHLDRTDEQILQHLQKDARITNQTLSEKVGLSTSPCWRKVRQFEETGLIEGYGAKLNRRKIGLGVLAFIRVKIDSHDEAQAEEFAKKARELPEVIACYSIAGDADFLLQVVANNLDNYADFAMSRIRRLPHIKEMQTSMVLKEIKPFEGFPINLGTR